MEEEIAPPPVASDDLQLSTSETISPGLPVKKSLSFNDIDEMDSIPTKDTLQLPHQQKSLETEGSSLPVDNTTTNLASDKLNIGGDASALTHEEVHSLDPPSVEVLPDLLIDDIEIL